METAIVRKPKFDLRFVTETSEFHIVHDTAVSTDNRFMTESIVSMTTTNALEDDSAAFSFVLAGDMEWDRILTANDMVILTIKPNEQVPGQPGFKDEVRRDVVMIGLVSEVRFEGTYKDDTKLYRITGQSFAKAFMQFELSTVRQVSMPMTGGWLDTTDEEGETLSGQVMGSTVKDTVDLLLARFMHFMRYHFDEGETDNIELSTRIRTDTNSWLDDERLVDPTPFLNFEGSFNQLLNEVVTRPFCEKFFDVWITEEGNEKALFTVRRTPFDKPDWNNLTRHTLYSRDVIEESVAQSDLDAYSVFNVVPENGQMTATGGMVRPKFHPSLVSKYGYRMLEVTHRFISNMQGASVDDDEVDNDSDNGTETGAGNDIIDRYSTRLYDWYVNNPNFLAGNIIVLGHPDYRLGNRLLYKDVHNNYMYEYYIESVEHNFSYTEGFTTTLGVTRGLRINHEQDDGGRFNPPTGEAQDFKGGYLGEMSIADMQRANSEGATEAGSTGGFNNSQIRRPAEGRITSGYGYRNHPVTGQRSFHQGIDVAGGGREIRAMADGTVTAAGWAGTYGRRIIISHGDLSGEQDVYTLYAHLETEMVSVGQQVTAGQQIGVMGATGRVTGIHLHFEVHENGQRNHVDPLTWVSYGGSNESARPEPNRGGGRRTTRGNSAPGNSGARGGGAR